MKWRGWSARAGQGAGMYPVAQGDRHGALRIDPTMGTYRCTPCDWHHVIHEDADGEAGICTRGRTRRSSDELAKRSTRHIC
ncbi:hypothetical protein [Puerhibacterium sp. TATVAM-FAB25]|uniref:hypothetical protein n=1 Tax=Puerhibacterium sp. TATVAM-FAB25 TaxID=3093699 RepID=UPI00397A1236